MKQLHKSGPKWIMYSSMGLELGLSVVIGFLIGSWLDDWFGRLNMSKILKNKKIIISAGASGIGWSAAKLFLNRGATVYLCDIDLLNLLSLLLLK